MKVTRRECKRIASVFCQYYCVSYSSCMLLSLINLHTVLGLSRFGHVFSTKWHSWGVWHPPPDDLPGWFRACTSWSPRGGGDLPPRIRIQETWANLGDGVMGNPKSRTKTQEAPLSTNEVFLYVICLLWKHRVIPHGNMNGASSRLDIALDLDVTTTLRKIGPNSCTEKSSRILGHRA